MSALWCRPTRYLTIVVSLLPGPRQYGFGWNWRGHVWGVWHEVGTAFWRWHTPTKIDPMPEPTEGYEWGVADDGSLIHVPRVVSPEQQEGPAGHSTRRMLQALDGYWLHCDGLPRGRCPRSCSTAEDWWGRFEKYRALTEAALSSGDATRPTGDGA